MSTDKKKKLGQFYTTNYNYILQNLNIDENIINFLNKFLYCLCLLVSI